MPVSLKRRGNFSGSAYGRAFKRRRGWRAPLRRRRGTRYRGRSKVYKNLSLSLAEPKQKCFNASFPGDSDPVYLGKFQHNVLYSCKLHDAAATNPGVFAVYAGTDNIQRVGREIFATGLRIRGVFKIPFDRRNVRVKMWFLKRNSIQGDPTTKANFFQSGGTGNVMLDTVNNERFKARLLMDRRLTARDLYVERGELTDSGSDASMYYDFWIPIRKKFKYGSDNNVVTNINEFWELIVTAYDTTSTVQTDSVMTSNEQTVTFYYKDP